MGASRKPVRVTETVSGRAVLPELGCNRHVARANIGRSPAEVGSPCAANTWTPAATDLAGRSRAGACTLGAAVGRAPSPASPARRAGGGNPPRRPAHAGRRGRPPPQPGGCGCPRGSGSWLCAAACAGAGSGPLGGASGGFGWGSPGGGCHGSLAPRHQREPLLARGVAGHSAGSPSKLTPSPAPPTRSCGPSARSPPRRHADRST